MGWEIFHNLHNCLAISRLDPCCASDDLRKVITIPYTLHRTVYNSSPSIRNHNPHLTSISPKNHFSNYVHL